MRLLSLFNGPIPYPPRLPVCGVDVLRPCDIEPVKQFAAHAQIVMALCAVPNTPFTGRFRYVQAD